MDLLTVVPLLSAYLGGLRENMYFIFFSVLYVIIALRIWEAEPTVVKYLPHTKKFQARVPDKMRSSNYCKNTHIRGRFLRKTFKVRFGLLAK
jgi:hypothetical protein